MMCRALIRLTAKPQIFTMARRLLPTWLCRIFVGDGFRGATWISLHNGGGVGWGEVINGGFGMTIDGSPEAEERLKMMLHWDVNNGISRRSWARNKPARFAIEQAMKDNPDLKVTLPEEADDALLDRLL